MDDLFVAIATWEEHVQTLSTLLSQLQETGSTDCPSKCQFGCCALFYLGPKVDQGVLFPDQTNQLLCAPTPRTKMRTDRY